MTNPVVDVWNFYVLPWLPQHGQRLLQQGRNHKLTTISTAIMIVGLYFAYDKIARPPRHLRHIPRIGFFRYLSAVARGKMVDEIARDITLPAAIKAEGGIYMVGTIIIERPATYYIKALLTFIHTHTHSDLMNMVGLFILRALKLPSACCLKWVKKTLHVYFFHPLIYHDNQISSPKLISSSGWDPLFSASLPLETILYS